MAVLYVEAQIWENFRDQAVIWEGKSFLHYRHYRELLNELPVSPVAAPIASHNRRRVGNRDYIDGHCPCHCCRRKKHSEE